MSLTMLAAIVAALALLLVLAALGRRGSGRDLMRPPPGLGGKPTLRPPPPPTNAGGESPAALPAEVEAELRALLGQGRKLEAIKLLRAATGLSLGEAKDYVERMPRGGIE